MQVSAVRPGRCLHEIFRERAREAPQCIALTTPKEPSPTANWTSAAIVSPITCPSSASARMSWLDCARRSPEAIVGVLGDDRVAYAGHIAQDAGGIHRMVGRAGARLARLLEATVGPDPPEVAGAVRTVPGFGQLADRGLGGPDRAQVDRAGGRRTGRTRVEHRSEPEGSGQRRGRPSRR